MTEPEWLSSTDPTSMLEFLKGKANDRKLRLFAVACCRGLMPQIAEKPYLWVVGVAERFADGSATAVELTAGSIVAEKVAMWGSIEAGTGPLWLAAWYSDPYAGARDCAMDPDAPAAVVLSTALSNAGDIASLCLPWASGLGLPLSFQTNTLRDIFNPFALPLDPSWQTPTVLTLAQGIYTDRAFDRLPILADALNDAGCSNEDLLNHCRWETVHTRGCWALDLCLNRE